MIRTLRRYCQAPVGFSPLWRSYSREAQVLLLRQNQLDAPASGSSPCLVRISRRVRHQPISCVWIHDADASSSYFLARNAKFVFAAQQLSLGFSRSYGSTFRGLCGAVQIDSRKRGIRIWRSLHRLVAAPMLVNPCWSTRVGHCFA